MEVTVCTLTRDRTDHLRRQIQGLLRSRVAPAQHVVAVMGGHDPRRHVPRTPWRTRFVEVDGPGPLPLARARNTAVRTAETEGIVLLDVDCVPGSTLVESYGPALDRLDGLLMGGVRYLNPIEDEFPSDDEALHAAAEPHPARPEPPPPGQLEASHRYELFWSLSFAVRRHTLLDRVGGFDEGYGGYGAEDTDLAFRARGAGVPMAWVGGAWAYHQHHDTYDPPLQHAASIVGNARRFRDVWDRWPMEGWLAAFQELGLVRWDPEGDTLELVREPTPAELAAAHRPTAVPADAATRA